LFSVALTFLLPFTTLPFAFPVLIYPAAGASSGFSDVVDRPPRGAGRRALFSGSLARVFSGVSKGERNRIRVRVRAAMATQAQIEGRYLGGRPPYGYRLMDAGPHPNPAKAADGKWLHALAVDESAAAMLGRIFAEFLAGAGIDAIAEGLT
jgi:DNA invertase Pin-like site-specific DNA recombinase